MDKPPANNAFTLMEALLTLLIISLLTLISLKPSISHLEYFSRKMAAYSVLTQEKAFIAKENKDVRIEKRQSLFCISNFNIHRPSLVHHLRFTTMPKATFLRHIPFIVQTKFVPSN